MRVRTLPAALAALTLAAAGCGSKGESPSGGADRADTVRVGASLSLTGALAREGLLTREGYDVCRSVVNDKGGLTVGGRSHRLDISYQDDQSLPDTAAQLVDQFNDKGVKLILGPYGSATTEAAAAVVERNGQVMVDSSGADDKIFAKGYRRTFAVLSPATEYASSIVRAVTEMANPKPKTVVFLSADDGFSKTVTKGGVDEAVKRGLNVAAIDYFPSGTTDVSSSITKVKGLEPDLVIGSVHLAEGIAIIRQSRELGFRPSGGFGETVAPPTPDFARTLGPLANGVLGSTQWTSTVAGRDPLFGTARDYAATFQRMFHRPPEYHGAEATAACLALALAVQNAGSTDASKVRDALAALNTSSFFGPIRFDSTGKNVTKPMGVIQIQNGAVVSVWPKETQQRPMVWPGARYAG